MTDFRVTHTVNCTEQTFWDKVYFSEEYNRKLFFDALGFLVWREVERRQEGDELHRTVEATPKVGDLPAALQAVLRSGIGYRERAVFNSRTRKCRIEVTPNQLSDKVQVKLDIWTEPLPDGRCQRHVQGTVTAKVFGIGGLIERRVIADLESSFAVGARVANEYCTSLPTP